MNTKRSTEKRGGAQASLTTIEKHFAEAAALVAAAKAARDDVKRWKAAVRASGFDPAAILDLAREAAMDSDMKRKLIEKAEVRASYRSALPLFDFADGQEGV